MADKESTRDIVIATRTMVDGLDKKVDGLVDCLEGESGRPGIKSRLDVAEREIADMKSSAGKRGDRWWAVVLLMLSTAAGIVGNIVQAAKAK